MATLAEQLKACRRRIILETLSACDWNRPQAAAQLGIYRTHLYKMLKDCAIEIPEHKLSKFTKFKRHGHRGNWNC